MTSTKTKTKGRGRGMQREKKKRMIFRHFCHSHSLNDSRANLEISFLYKILFLAVIVASWFVIHFPYKAN